MYCAAFEKVRGGIIFQVRRSAVAALFRPTKAGLLALTGLYSGCEGQNRTDVNRLMRPVCEPTRSSRKRKSPQLARAQGIVSDFREISLLL